MHSVAEGGAFFSASIARWLVDHAGYRALDKRDRARRALSGLTPRHTEVLGLVAKGYSNARIARELSLTEGSVKVYVSAILDELGAENPLQAAILAHDAGIGSSPSQQQDR